MSGSLVIASRTSVRSSLLDGGGRWMREKAVREICARHFNCKYRLPPVNHGKRALTYTQRLS